MNNWNPACYREDSRLTCPFPLAVSMFTVKHLFARNAADQEVLREQYLSARHVAAAYRESMQGDPWVEPEFRVPPNRQMWYEGTMRGLPEIYLSILHELTYDQKHHANVLFGQEMDRQAETRELDQRFDVYLVYGVRVSGYSDMNPVRDREAIRGRAMVEIEQAVIDDLQRPTLRPGMLQAAEIATAIEDLAD